MNLLVAQYQATSHQRRLRDVLRYWHVESLGRLAARDLERKALEPALDRWLNKYNHVAFGLVSVAESFTNERNLRVLEGCYEQWREAFARKGDMAYSATALSNRLALKHALAQWTTVKEKHDIEVAKADVAYTWFLSRRVLSKWIAQLAYRKRDDFVRRRQAREKRTIFSRSSFL